MAEYGRNWIAAGLIAVGMTVAAPAMGQRPERVPVPPDGIAAFDKGEYGKAAEFIIPAFENCRTTRPKDGACADLAMAVAVLVATAGNARVEPNILSAQAYIDEQVGRDTPEALGVLGAVTSYYDRLVQMEKYLPHAERRLVLSRKLNGALARTSVAAAIGLCVVKWNLGKGQEAVELLAPLLDKLPTTTPQEALLAGSVYECTGTAYYAMDRDREAEPAFRKALALFEQAEGERGERAIDVMASLANTLRRLRRDTDARAMAARVDALAGPDAAARARIAWWAAPRGADQVGAARTELAKAEAQYGAQSVMADMAAANLGVALSEAGRATEAEPYLARVAAAAANEATPAAFRIKLLTGQVTLLLKLDNGRFDRALPVIQRLVALAKRTGAGSDRILIDFQMYAGTMLLLTDKSARAYPLLSDAGALFMERLASYRDFDPAALRETREYAPIFKFKVAAAWTLAQRR